MSEHLAKETVARLLSRQLPPAELLAATQHLSSCAECRQQCETARNFTAAAKSLATELNLAPADDLHLNYEQLEGYVDEQSSQAERDLVNKHLAICDTCAQEVKELSLLKSNLSSYPQVAAALSPASGSENGTSLQRFVALFRFRSVQFAALAAVLLLAAVLGLLLWRSRKQPELANGNRNNPIKVPVNSNPGSNSGPEDKHSPDEARRDPDKDATAKSVYDEVIATAITQQTLATPVALKDLNGKPVTLLGPAEAAQKFALLSPRGTVVQSARPTLHWQALTGADGYKVYLLNTTFDIVQNSEALNGQSWTVSHPLERGQTYIWQVVATKEGKEITAPVAPAKEARFKVLDSRSAQAIQIFAKENADNHLALGIVYAHHGLLDDAERQLASAATLQQSPELARKFLRELKGMRR